MHIAHYSVAQLLGLFFINQLLASLLADELAWRLVCCGALDWCLLGLAWRSFLAGPTMLSLLSRLRPLLLSVLALKLDKRLAEQVDVA